MTKSTRQTKVAEIEVAEYSEACENIRHYSGILSSVLTVFITVFAGLVAFGFENLNSNYGAQILFRISGLISTFMFWILAERASSYWYHFRKRASQLEEKLGYHLHSDRPQPRFKFLNTLFAARILFLFIGIFWGVAIWLSL